MPARRRVMFIKLVVEMSDVVDEGDDGIEMK